MGEIEDAYGELGSVRPSLPRGEATLLRAPGRGAGEVMAGVRRGRGPFVHNALFYEGPEEFVSRTAPFVREGLDEGEPVLVLVLAQRMEALRGALGNEASRVRWGDMADIGRNPARIISSWRDFADQELADRGRIRGIGEPIWAGRTEEEVVEALRHETLLNVAFDGVPAWILCPYDVALAPWILDEARRSHPMVTAGGLDESSSEFLPTGEIPGVFAAPLPEPLAAWEELGFERGDLRDLRRLLADRAAAAGVTPPKIEDLVLAANEVATNTLRHGGGTGTMRLWQENGSMILEIRDSGHIDDALVGRFRPAAGQESGIGLWLVNQICDLVQVRTYPAGTVIRLHVSLR